MPTTRSQKSVLSLATIFVAWIEFAIQVVKVKSEESHIGAMACPFSLDTFCAVAINRHAPEGDVLTTNQINAIDKCDVVVGALRLVVSELAIEEQNALAKCVSDSISLKKTSYA